MLNRRVGQRMPEIVYLLEFNGGNVWNNSESVEITWDFHVSPEGISAASIDNSISEYCMFTSLYNVDCLMC